MQVLEYIGDRRKSVKGYIPEDSRNTLRIGVLDTETGLHQELSYMQLLNSNVYGFDKVGISGSVVFFIPDKYQLSYLDCVSKVELRPIQVVHNESELYDFIPFGGKIDKKKDVVSIWAIPYTIKVLSTRFGLFHIGGTVYHAIDLLYELDVNMYGSLLEYKTIRLLCEEGEVWIDIDTNKLGLYFSKRLVCGRRRCGV